MVYLRVACLMKPQIKAFLYDTLHGGCMIACEIGEEESHAYCLTLELNQEALDESLNE